MATSVGFETAAFSGWWKTTYVALEKTSPSFALCKGMMPFEQQIGKEVRFPVHLRRSQGYTWKGAAGSVATSYTLNTPESPVLDEATITANECTLQEDLAYGAISRAGGGAKSYDGLLDVIIGENMKEGLDFMQELMLLYGGGATTRWANGIGVVESETDIDGSGTNTITFTTATWAPGVWAQLEGGFIDIYASDLSTLRNATTAVQVTSINLSTRTITVSGLEAELDTIAATDVVFPRGTNGQWSSGIFDQLSNAGTIFGISASTYTLWAPNSYAFGSDKLAYAKIMKGLTTGVYKGLDADVTILVSPDGWTDMANDAAALRRWTDSQKVRVERGTNKLVFYGVTMGEVSIVPHPMMMFGFAAAMVEKTWHRYGSVDTTFRLPNSGDKAEDSFWMPLENSTGIRFRGYWDLAPVCKRPAINTIFTGIVNNT